jgi:hypothetical protein
MPDGRDPLGKDRFQGRLLAFAPLASWQFLAVAHSGIEKKKKGRVFRLDTLAGTNVDSPNLSTALLYYFIYKAAKGVAANHDASYFGTYGIN